MQDPVCEMEVEEDEAVELVHEGKTYYFCCDGCMNIFKKNPSKYI
ncbi:MAG: YHS domain-containing protein [Thaumarchaeota archaeon]|nr:YHS domain-containing protein [Nitrososphaerota archaeon]